MDNFKVLLSMGLLKILTFELYILASIVPLHQDPHLFMFIDMVSTMDLSNIENVTKYKKPIRWPDCQILFEMDSAYQNKVSFKTACLRNCLF
jgi:hypothetical protein